MLKADIITAGFTMLHKNAKCSLCDRIMVKDKDTLTVITEGAIPAFICSNCYGIHVDAVSAKLRVLMCQYSGTPEQKEEIRELLHSMRPWHTAPSDDELNEFIGIHTEEDAAADDAENEDDEPCDCPACRLSRMLIGER